MLAICAQVSCSYLLHLSAVSHLLPVSCPFVPGPPSFPTFKPDAVACSHIASQTVSDTHGRVMSKVFLMQYLLSAVTMTCFIAWFLRLVSEWVPATALPA
jgi:hypothetical protein